jgi:hypothetical protein
MWGPCYSDMHAAARDATRGGHVAARHGLAPHTAQACGGSPPLAMCRHGGRLAAEWLVVGRLAGSAGWSLICFGPETPGSDTQRPVWLQFRPLGFGSCLVLFSTLTPGPI